MPTAIQQMVAMPGTQIGQKRNAPEEFLEDMISPYTRNMELNNLSLQARYGLAKTLNVALSGRVLTQATLDASDVGGSLHDIFITPKDIYKLDLNNSRFDILTPTYTTGTIEVQVGTPTILRGTGTSWLANVKVGDYVKLGSGSIHTGSTWYLVTVVTSDVLLTVSSAMPTTGAGSAYVVRKTFTGGDNDYWDWVQFTDMNLGELIVMTNGVDYPYYYTGTGQVVKMTSLPATLTAARYVSVFAGRLIFAWVVEGGNNQPQRLELSEPYDITLWDADASPIDLVDEPTEIRGMAKLGSYHIVFKETNAYIGNFIGGDFVINYTLSFQCKGVRSAWSIVAKNDFVYYYGSDKKFKKYNVLSEENISESNFPETVDFDPNYDEYVQGFDVVRKNQIRWFSPKGSTTKNNYVYVFDYLYNVSIPWEYQHADACCSMGSIVRTTDAYCDDASLASTYADGMAGFCDDSSLLDNAPLIIYGGYDGYIRYADNGSDDDGTAFTRLLRLKRFNFGMPTSIKRLWIQQWWLLAGVSGSVTAKLMTDDKTTYETGSKTISLIPDDSAKDITKVNVVWDVRGYNFQPEISATVFFGITAMTNMYFPKRTTIKG